ncbi:MAG TPA: PspA/IM30 family protein [Thermomonas sp.]|nr:PspA/IM30 family protein [Thermomonas sp.]
MPGLLGQWLARLGGDVAGVSDALFGDRVERRLDQDIRAVDDVLHRLRADIASAKASRIVARQHEQDLRTRIAELTAQAEQALRGRKRTQAREAAERIVALQPLLAEAQAQATTLAEQEAALAHALEQGEYQLRRLKHQVDILRASASLQQAQASVARRRSAGAVHPEPAMAPAQRARQRKAGGGPESRATPVSPKEAAADAADAVLERIARRMKPKVPHTPPSKR